MKAKWAGILKNIGQVMFWKLVNNVNNKIIARSTICLAIGPGTANLQVDPIKPLGENFKSTPDDRLHTKIFSLKDNKNPIDSLPTQKSWFEEKRDHKHHEDSQQRHFYCEQPTVIKHQHRYLTRSKSREAYTS